VDGEAQWVSGRVGRLRLENLGYKVGAGATGEERSGHGSDKSRALIIKKGVEWSVDFDRFGSNIDKSRAESSASCGFYFL
jgi:hypothetical protein